MAEINYGKFHKGSAGKLRPAGKAAITVMALTLILFSISVLNTGVSAHAYEPDTAAGAQGRMLIPLGYTAGIKMYSDGVLIVGVSQGDGESSPARQAGLEPGDLITEINSKKISSTEDLKNAVQSGGKLAFSVTRGGAVKKIELTPMKSAEDGTLKIGAWVRDSIAGIGTLTYFDPETGVFGALGHGINDTDTASLMPIAKGSLVKSSVSSVRRGEAGSPGELKGSFDVACEYGSLYANTEQGIFGIMDRSNIYGNYPAMPVASLDEIKTGKAYIISNVDGESTCEYEIEITKIITDGSKSPRDMCIEITDERLIEKTGGIVQGMSGSPIIQDGKIIGAVTHVLINQPCKGYGISIENMLAGSSRDEKLAA